MKKQFILLIVLLISITFHAGQTFADEITEHFEQGYIAFEQHDYDIAIASFKKVLKLFNINPIEAGKEYRKHMADIEKNPKTKDGKDRAVAFNKLWLDTYYCLGLAYAYKGDKVNALKQVVDLRHIGRNDYASSLEGEINYLINSETAKNE
jgi:tetratricopeptide (TPR) repeat protein